MAIDCPGSVPMSLASRHILVKLVCGDFVKFAVIVFAVSWSVYEFF